MTTKKLYRSHDDVMIAGVCSGLANYFELDPTIIRLAFVFLLLAASGGFWIYLILWIVMPLAPKEEQAKVAEIQPGMERASIKTAKVEEPAKSKQTKLPEEEPKTDSSGSENK